MSDGENQHGRKTRAKKRAEHRPRLDAVLRAIKDGRYDDDMGVLMGALQDRQAKRQEAVLALVHEAFGEDFVVTQKRTIVGARGFSHPTAPGVTMQGGGFGSGGSVEYRGGDQGAGTRPPIPEGWVDTTDEAAAPQVTETKVESTIEGEDEEGFESRSPIIGPLPQE